MDLVEHDGIGSAQYVQALTGDLADDPDRQSRAGEGLAPHDLLGQAKLLPNGPHLVLEQIAQWLDELESHVVGQASHVVVALDPRRIAGPGFDHVGVQRPLDEIGGVLHVGCDLLEHPDEGFADDLPLLLRVGHTFQGAEEPVLGLHVNEVHIERLLECLLHLGRLTLAEQAVIDKDAHQLVTDGPVHQCCGNRRIDAAGQPADNRLVANRVADGGDRLLDDADVSPCWLGMTHAVEEVLEDLLAPRRVRHLGVELHSIQAAVGGFHCRHRRIGGGARHRESFGCYGDRIAVAHPYRLLYRETAEERP